MACCDYHETNIDWLLGKLKEQLEKDGSGTIYNIYQTINGVQPIKVGNTVQKQIRNYTYENMLSDINKLLTKYPRIKYQEIGNSVMGNKLIVLNYGSETAYKHLFVFNGFHAYDTTASIALAQLETLILNENYMGLNLWNDILGKDTCVHIIPMANPDGYRLCSEGFIAFPDMSEDIKNNIKNLVTEYMRTQAKEEELGSVWTATEKEDVENYIRSLGGDPSTSWKDYQFREEDLHVWAANINGIDLYYNWYDVSINQNNRIITISDRLTENNHSAWRYGACGTTGIVDENSIYKQFIDSFKSRNNFLCSALCYHQKGPTKIWNYGIRGYQLQRNTDCFRGLCEVTATPYVKTFEDSSVVGFNAWFLRYGNWEGTLACNCEVGFKYDEIAGDGWNNIYLSDEHIVRSPVPDSQWNWIFEQEKHTLLYMVRFYTSCRDVWNSHGMLSAFNFRDSYTDERFAVPSMRLISSLITQIGNNYNSLKEMGLDKSASLQDIIEKLNYSASAVFPSTTGFTIENDLPFFAYSKIGYWHIYPMTSSCMIVDFYPHHAPYQYRKVYNKDGKISDWINMTPISTDYISLGVTDGIPSASVSQLADVVGIYQTLVYDLNKTSNNITELPAEVGSSYRLTIIGQRPNNRVEITDISSGNKWIAQYSRSTHSLSNWYKIQATRV